MDAFLNEHLVVVEVAKIVLCTREETRLSRSRLGLSSPFSFSHDRAVLSLSIL